jgi:hypothetical protein
LPTIQCGQFWQGYSLPSTLFQALSSFHTPVFRRRKSNHLRQYPAYGRLEGLRHAKSPTSTRSSSDASQVCGRVGSLRSASQTRTDLLMTLSHRTATQLHRFPVFVRYQLIVLESLRRLFWCRLDGLFGGGRLAGLNSSGKSLAQQADRTEFHCSRKLVAATRAGALRLRAHRPNRPSAAF